MNKYKIILFILITLSVNLFAEDFSTPMSRVRNSVDQVIMILQQKEMERAAKWEKIGVVINDSFDFRSMSQSVLAANWKRATPEEREQFVEFFTKYLEETYRTKIENYSDQKVEYLKETINGKRAEVKTEIITDQTRIPVDYKLKNNDGQWYAYDVVIEGVSLVNNYKTTFSTIVKNEGMDGLINDIQSRIDKYKKSEEMENTQSEI